MFQKVLEIILQSYVGKYVEDIDKQSLNVSVFNGEVDLKDLKLKESILD